MNDTPIYQYAKPTRASLEPPKSSKPILIPVNELCPCLIKIVREQSFSEQGNKNSYFHLREFGQTYACLHIAGMSDETFNFYFA
jgi:hypothetical protein